MDHLEDLHGLRKSPLDRWLAEHRAVTVKSGPHRTVHRVELPGGVFYAKHYLAPGLRARLQNLLRSCRAVREANAAQLVAQAGIPTIETVAIGWQRSGPAVTDSFLLTREIPDVLPLDRLLESEPGTPEVGVGVDGPAARPVAMPPGARHRLADELGRLVGRLHRCKLIHRDLHAGNILVRIDPDGEVRLWLIDLHEVSRQRRCSLNSAVVNVSLLNNLLTHYASRSDRRRFLRGWWSEFQPPSDWSLPKVARRLESTCRREFDLACLRGDRKWQRGNRRLMIADTDERRCRGLSWLGRDFLHSAREQPARFFATGPIVAARQGNDEQAATVRLQLDDRDVTARAQRFIDRSGTMTARRCRERSWSQVRRGWEYGHAFRRRRIGVAVPLLFVEAPGEHGTEQLLLTAEISDAHSLVRAGGAASRRLATELGRQVRNIHRSGFDYRPLNGDAILVSDDCRNPAVWFTRPAEAERRRVTDRLVVRRLGQLSDSLPARMGVRLTQRLRFLKAYLGSSFDQDWKWLWRRIEGPSTEPRNRAAPARRPARAGMRAAMLIAALCVAGGGCLWKTPQTVARPARHSIRADQLLVLSDFRLPRDHPLIHELVTLRRQVSDTLKLPLVTEEEVVVYIFDSQLKYRQYLNAVYPGLPERRAYFVGTPQELSVYTFWGERIQEDLRHEYTHGLLHAALNDVPLWLDEGLAEYFEVPGPRPGTVNPEYASRLAASLANSWRPDLKRLERLKFSQMQHVDYQESWAWVHFLMHNSTTTRGLLLSYIDDLRHNRPSAPLSQQVERELPDFRSRFVGHVAALQMPRFLATQPAHANTPSPAVAPAGHMTIPH